MFTLHIGAELLQARERVGGRVYKSQTHSPLPVESDALFVHGDEAPT